MNIKNNILILFMDDKIKTRAKRDDFHKMQDKDKMTHTEIVNKGGRPRKDILFKLEREETMNKLNKILNITDSNNNFCISDLEKDADKIKQIMALKPDVEKYFKGKALAVFTNENAVKPYIGLIRIIYKGNNYNLNLCPASYSIIKGEKQKNMY